LKSGLGEFWKLLYTEHSNRTSVELLAITVYGRHLEEIVKEYVSAGRRKVHSAWEEA
jgi:hypothetical protein